MRVLVHGRAVAQFRHGDEIVSTDGAQELTHVRSAAQAAIACAAVRRARHAHAIADLHAPDVGAHRLHDADAAMSLDDGHVVHPARAIRRRERRRRRCGSCCRSRLNAEHGWHVRITEIGGLGAHDHLAAADRLQHDFFEPRARGPFASADPRLEAARGHDGRRTV